MARPTSDGRNFHGQARTNETHAVEDGSRKRGCIASRGMPKPAWPIWGMC